jgi:hypothetical protein
MLCLHQQNQTANSLAAQTHDLTSHWAHGSASATQQFGNGAQASQSMAKASSTATINACTNLCAL